jgi:sulfiredoxin
MKAQDIPIGEIYIPAARRKTLDQDKADALAEDIMENGHNFPIQVRQGKGRYVLVEGLHRLEACQSLGEEKISAYIVQAKKF